MSKASQRRLAEQQKRGVKKKGVSQLDANRVLDMFGHKMQDDDPYSFWKFSSAAAEPAPAHQDDKMLETIFHSMSDFLGYVDAAANSNEEERLVCPGMLFKFDKDGVRIGRPNSYGFEAIETSFEGKGPHEHLAHMFPYVAEQGEFLMWVTGLAVRGIPLACWTLSRSGGCIARIYVDDEWLRMSNPSVLNSAAEETRQYAVKFSPANEMLNHPCRSEVMVVGPARQDEYLRDLISAASEPFVEMIGACHAFAKELREHHAQTGESIRAVIGEVKQKTSRDIEDLKRRGLSEAERLRGLLQKTQQRESELIAELALVKKSRPTEIAAPRSTVAERMLAFV